MHAATAIRRPSPTSAEDEALRFFHEYTERHFLPPSMDECARHLRLPYMEAWRILHALWSQGHLLQEEDRQLRPWRLAKAARPSRTILLRCAGDVS